MSAKHFGIDPAEIYPQPDFRAARDTTGKWTGSRSYQMNYESFDDETIRAKFRKGTAIINFDLTLDPNVWAFLKVDEIEIEDNAGGIKAVFVNFTGFWESEYESDREVSYEMRGVLTERDIRQHPNYLDEVTGELDRRGVSEYIDDKAYVPPTEKDGSFVRIREIQTQEEISYITDATVRKWWDKIEAGLRAYLAPSVEWTKTTTNLSGISDADFQKLGKVDTPPGSPPKVHPSATWLKTGVNETREEDSITTSETWLQSDKTGWDSDLYNY